MGSKKKKWYQTGEFEDGYQFGDIYRTIKNAVNTNKDTSKASEDKTKLVSGNKKESKTKEANNTNLVLGKVENGRLSLDPAAQLYGYSSEAERRRYKQENPELYAAMGGVKHVPIGAPVQNTNTVKQSDLAVGKVVNRFKNTDIEKLKKAINSISSGKWQDANTMKEYSDTVNTYANDYIALEKLGYFNYLSDEERKSNVEMLRSIKKDVDNKKTLYTTFRSVYDYNAYIMNNTVDQENGMSAESIAARTKAYEANTARMREIEGILDNVGSSEVVTDEGLKGWLMKFTADYDLADDGIDKKALIDEYEFLREQNRLYERYNKENDSLTTQYANSMDFISNSVYVPRKSKNSESAFYPDEYRTFLEYYSVGTDATVHSERVKNGQELDDYWYAAQSRGWDYATEDEFKMLNYLANTQGDAAAQEYFESLSKDLTRRRSIAKEEKWDENYKNAEWYEKIGLNALSVPEKLYGTMFNAIEDVGNIITGQEYDHYAAYRDITAHGDNTRKNTAFEIDEVTGGDELLGVSWGDAYQAAMSGIDSIAGVATFGGKVYPVIVGIGASSAKAKQLYEQGASSRQIAAASVFAGIAEMAFEKISIGYFLDEFVNAPAKKWFQLLGKSVMQGGIEMTEEMATELSNIITDTMVLGSRSDWGKLISSYKQQGCSDSDAIISAMWDMGGNILEAGICGLISGGTISIGGSAVNRLSNKNNDVKTNYISFEEFANSESKIWNNVDYYDNETKFNIMQAMHNEMVDDGAIVKVTQETLESVAESFPDLRGVKKKERTPILKESMNNLKENIRQFLNGFKNRNFEFEIKGKILEARLYNTGINEVLEKITQEKANMLYSTEDIFKNSRYLYSTTDYDGDPNIYRWNYFYTPVQIGEEIVGVRIAVRDIATPRGSQIYNWNIKRDASLDGVGRGKNNRISHGVSSDASNYNILESTVNVKGEQSQKSATLQGGVAPFVSKGTDIETTPFVKEKDGMRIIGANKSIDEDAFVEGMWEDSPNSAKDNIENSRLESVENIDGNGIIKAMPLSRYVNSSDGIYVNSSKIKPISNFEDMVIHGDAFGFQINDKDGNPIDNYNAIEFANILKEDPNYHGGNIRLISCESGSVEFGAAQILANELGVEVLAPTDIVWITMDGEMIVGPTEFENTGEWKIFRPKRRK